MEHKAGDLRHSSLTRRVFLGSLAAGGGLLATRLRAAERSDVLVLGAGLSGLYTAMLLEEAGARVTVLEAADHVGGRVRTRDIGGYQHELGASDVGVMYARIIDVATRMKLELEPSTISVRPFSYHIGGQLLAAADWESSAVNETVGDERALPPNRLESELISRYNPLRYLEDWLDPEQVKYDVPIAAFLRDKGVSPAAIRLIGQSFNGNSVDRVSALSMLRDNARTRFGINAWRELRAAGEDIAPLRQIVGGNQRLPEAMAAWLQAELRFNSPAATVSQARDGVTVTCLDGSRYRADYLVCTLPLTSMRYIDFDPALSPGKAALAGCSEYYSATKFYLRPKTRFWESDGFQPSMWTDTTIGRVFAMTNGDDVHTLLVWINGAGSRRIDQLQPEAARELVLAELTRLRPASRGQVEVMGYHAWGRVPYVEGCGFNYTAGQIARHADDIAAAEGRIHFAGEHTRRREFGMESAMASAERVATEILVG